MKELLHRIAGLSPQKRALLAQRNPLSFSQQRVWFLDQLEPGNPFYNIPLAVQLEGDLEVGILARALDEIVRRQQILRTVFPSVDGQPLQLIGPPEPVLLPVVDLSVLAEEGRTVEAARLVQEEVRRPMSLEEGPLLRVQLLTLARQRHVVLLTMHHIISDGVSFEVFIRELATLYSAFSQGGLSPLPELPIQFVDYARWQRQWLRGEVWESLLSYWKQQLAGMPPGLDLPADRSRPPVQTFRGAVRSLELSADLCTDLRTLARGEGSTLFMLLLAAFQVLLYRYSGQRDIAVGTPMANRNRIELEGLIGFFLNTLVLRTRWEGDPVCRELIQQVRESVLGAHAHQDLPFESLVDELQPERSLDRQPLFQVVFTLKGVRPTPRFPGLAILPLEVDKKVSKFDLTLSAQEKEGRIALALEYNTDLFETATSTRMLAHFERLLEGIAGDPDRRLSDLRLLSGAEQAQLLTEWNDTQNVQPLPGCVHGLFEAQAERCPDATALVFMGRSVSYGELNRRADRLAGRLRERGLGPGELAGICLERSVGMVVAVLAVLKAGGAYVPLDPAYPPDRLAYMLEDAGVAVLLTEGELAAELPLRGERVLRLEGEAEADAPSGKRAPGPAVRGDDLAYVIYTSGSTGKPKGVQVPHRGVVGLMADLGRRLAVTPADRLLAVTTLSFDIAALELFLPLSVGACVELISRETASDGGALAAQLAASGATLMQATPATWQLLLEAGWRGREGLRALCGGEALSPVLASELATRVGEVWNLYGPTETTIWSSAFRIEGRWETGHAVPIGHPVADTQMYVQAPDGGLCPLGVPGELLIGGAGVVRGYFKQPAMTAAKFVPDPFASRPGARLYRTGDLSRRRSEGSLEFLGRIDHQVKVRGFRVEPGEIESRLRIHPAVREAVVVARQERGYAILVAYVVAGPELPGTGALRAFVRQELPEYMVPSAFLLLDSLPLTPNGKVDRRALPSPGAVQAGAEAGFVAPQTAVQEIVAGVWAEILGRQRVGLFDSFFDLGGHSLLATRVVSRLRESFQVDLPLRKLFEAPTVAALAAAVETATRGRRGAVAPPLLPRAREEEPPLSFAQERLWFLDQLEPGSLAYNLPFALRLTGRIERPALLGALDEIVRRHEALRTVFLPGGGERGAGPVQVIRAAEPAELPLVDLAGLPAERAEREVTRILRHDSRRAFELARGPLVRWTLLRSGAEQHVLSVELHHIISDAWSIRVFLRELCAHYQAVVAGGPSPLPALPVQYADYARWQRDWLQGEVLAEQLAYWRGQLAGAPARLELPTDRPRPAVQSYRGAQLRIDLPEDVTHALTLLGRRHGCTLFMTLLASFQILLARYSRSEDVPVGTPIANRSRGEVEGLIGLFVNTLVLRGDVAEDPSFVTLLARVRNCAFDAYAHQELPFERLVEELRPQRDLAHSPLFQVMFLLWEPISAELLTLPDLAAAPLLLENETAKFDLTLGFQPWQGGLTGSISFNRDLFDAVTIERWAAHLRHLVDGLITAPESRLSCVPLMTQAEREQVLIEWNRTGGEPLEQRFAQDLFAAQAAQTPDALALVQGPHRLTFQELDVRSNRLANRLRRLGVGPEVLVGIYLDRSVELVVGLLAVLKSGGAYVPLDPLYPSERIAFMTADAGVGIVLSSGALAQGWPGDPATRLLDLGASAAGEPDAGSESLDPVGLEPEHLAYLIYTSGSTGRPKGAMIAHRGLSNYLAWAARSYGGNGGGGSVVHTSISFDLTVTSLFVPWLAGQRVVLAENGEGIEPLLSVLQQEEGLSFLKLTPSHARFLGGQSSAMDLGRWSRALVVGGEALNAEDLASWREGAPATRIYNEYGPTETVVGCCVHEVPAGALSNGVLPIGRPIAHTRLYILDRHLMPTPPGVAGELYIGGAGLARGYWKRPQITAERFIPDPYGCEPGDRLYRTGDLARYLADGVLEFLGRLDEQVKVRGYRVELGEVEEELRRLAAVKDVAVVKESGEGERLIAYIVPPESGAAAIEDLRLLLEARLPKYMVPAIFVEMEALPLTPNGKVDRKALPDPEWSRLRGTGTTAPCTVTQVRLAEIWAEVLRLDASAIRIDDSFFDLGGHSLLAAQVVSRVREAFQVDLPLQTLFRGPTIAALATAVENLSGAGAPGQSRRIEPLLRTGSPLPLSFSQQLLWFAHQLDPGSSAYNIPSAVRLSGRLDVAALRASLGEVLRRHEVLRSAFPASENGPVQTVLPLEVSFPLLDLSGLPAAQQSEEVARLVSEEAEAPFRLSQGPLLRASLLRLEDRQHVALLTMHHVVSDAWSMGVLIREIAAHYRAFVRNLPSPLPDLPIQYADYASWQRQWLRGELLDSQIGYWKRQLGPRLPQLDLPSDRPRPPVRTSRGAKLPFALPPDLTAPLKDLCRSEGCTLFMVLLTAFKILLRSQARQDDIVVGTNVANRNRLETEGLIGVFINQLVLRTDLSGDSSYRGLLHRVREVVLNAFAHQDLPFEKLVEVLQPPRDPSRPVLFQVKFEVLNAPTEGLELPDLAVSPLEIGRQVVRYDLHLTVSENARGITGALLYSTDLFEPATVEQMLRQYLLLLANVIRNPDLSLSELEEVLAEAERTTRGKRQEERRQQNLEGMKRARRRVGIA